MRVLSFVPLLLLVCACSSAPSSSIASPDGGPADSAIVSSDAGTIDAPKPSDAARAGSGSASVTGTVAGALFSAKDALSSPVVWANHRDGGPAMAGGASILIGQYETACGAPYPSMSPFLWIDLYAAGPLVPGVYPTLPNFEFVQTQRSASQLVVGALYGACDLSVPGQADSGTVTIALVSVNAIEGSFDVKLSSGETVTGSFRAPTCDRTDGIACVLHQ